MNKLPHACTVADQQGLLPCCHLTAVFHLAEANGEKVRGSDRNWHVAETGAATRSSSVFSGLCILPPALVAQHTPQVVAAVPPARHQVRNPKKLQSIKQMLNVYMQQEEDLLLNGGARRACSTACRRLPAPATPPLLHGCHAATADGLHACKWWRLDGQQWVGLD